MSWNILDYIAKVIAILSKSIGNLVHVSVAEDLIIFIV